MRRLPGLSSDHCFLLLYSSFFFCSFLFPLSIFEWKYALLLSLSFFFSIVNRRLYVNCRWQHDALTYTVWTPEEKLFPDLLRFGLELCRSTSFLLCEFKKSVLQSSPFSLETDPDVGRDTVEFTCSLAIGPSWSGLLFSYSCIFLPRYFLFFCSPSSHNFS